MIVDFLMLNEALLRLNQIEDSVFAFQDWIITILNHNPDLVSVLNNVKMVVSARTSGNELFSQES